MEQKQTEQTVPFGKQFTLRGMMIGAVGAVILTTSSMYVALTLGALPWPIIFVALVSMFSLKLLGNTNINEINVTHTAMSAGAMVAGGLAFTIPGIWMLQPDAQVNFGLLLVIVLGGVVLGLIFTALIRKYFIETKELPYPMGVAAAETLSIGDKGGKKAGALFGSMGGAAIFTVLRDWFHKIPAMAFGNVAIPGVSFGLWMSPMMISVGYIIGPLLIGVLFAGALLGDFGIVVLAPKLGLWDAATAANIKSSLGIGVMVGTGIGIIVKGILPKAKELFGPMFQKANREDSIINLRWAPIVLVALAFVFTFVANMGVLASIVTILGVWLATSMSAQVVGQSGVNPMEVFGVIVLLAAKLVSHLGYTEAFFVAAIVAIACGLAGDVMNDFKAGHLVHSSPKAQWLGEVIGGIIGGLVSVGVLYVMIQAYGTDAFGAGKTFVAPQASMVAAMVGGIPHMTAFVVGLVAGVLLYVVNFPVMTLGLGIYLPFYLSLTIFVGGVFKFIVEKIAPAWDRRGTGLIIASGLLGGEAVVGVVIALIQVCMGFGA